MPEKCLMEIPSNILPIVAQGLADMREGVFLHRFYPDDDSLLLQILGGDGESSQSIKEITLFHVLDCIYPSDDTKWSEWRQKITKPTFFMESLDVNFERAWFNNSTSDEEPVSFWETVYDQKVGGRGRKIFQTCMLYVRSLDQFDEFLLVNLEEDDQGERCVSLMTGVTLTRNQISV